MLRKGPSGWHYGGQNRIKCSLGFQWANVVRRSFDFSPYIITFIAYSTQGSYLPSSLSSWHFNAEMLRNTPLSILSPWLWNHTKTAEVDSRSYFQCSIKLLWRKHLTATLVITNKPFNCSKLSQIEHSCLYLQPGDGPFKFPLLYVLCSWSFLFKVCFELCVLVVVQLEL